MTECCSPIRRFFFICSIPRSLHFSIRFLALLNSTQLFLLLLLFFSFILDSNRLLPRVAMNHCFTPSFYYSPLVQYHYIKANSSLETMPLRSRLRRTTRKWLFFTPLSFQHFMFFLIFFSLSLFQDTPFH